MVLYKREESGSSWLEQGVFARRVDWEYRINADDTSTHDFSVIRQPGIIVFGVFLSCGLDQCASLFLVPSRCGSFLSQQDQKYILGILMISRRMLFLATLYKFSNPDSSRSCITKQYNSMLSPDAEMPRAKISSVLLINTGRGNSFLWFEATFHSLVPSFR